MLLSLMKTTEKSRFSISRDGVSLFKKCRISRRSIVCLRCLLITRNATSRDRLFRRVHCSIYRRSETQGLLLHRLIGISFISTDDPLNQRMPDDVAIVEMNERNALDTRNNPLGFDETGELAKWKINLCDVTGNDCFAVVAN